MKLISVITALILANPVYGYDEYFTTNPVVESEGVAGAEFLLTRFNHLTSSRDFRDHRLKLYLSVNRGWYQWQANPNSKFYYFHLSKGLKETKRVGIDFRLLRFPEKKQTGEYGETVRTIRPYCLSVRSSYTATLLRNSGFGVAIELTREDFGRIGAGAESKKFQTTFFSFYIGYTKFGLFKSLTFTPGLLPLPEDYRIDRPYEDRGLSLTLDILNMGPHISLFDDSQADPQPQRMLLGLRYKLIDSPTSSMSFLVSFEKPLTSYNEEKERWDPFYKALLSGWPNDPHEIEKKDAIYRLGTEIEITKYFALRFGKYRYPKYDRQTWYDGRKKKKYEYTTWGFTLHSPVLTVSGAFLNSDLQVNPWETKVSFILAI